MRFSLLANAAAVAFFSGLAACSGIFRWEVLLFQLVLQWLTNEFWMDVFALPFKGQHFFGVERDKLAALARVRRVARWSSAFLLLFPVLLLVALLCFDFWGEGALGRALHLPLGRELVGATLAAQGLLFALSLAGGLVPLSYRTLTEALMARHERRLLQGGRYPASAASVAAAPVCAGGAPARAGVDALPHGLPEGVHLPSCLSTPQRCSPLHARHVELVRSSLREGERAILSTAPCGVVPLPSSSNERSYGGLGLCLAAALLYTAIGLFEEDSSHAATRWVVMLLGFGLLLASIRLLRSSARRQAGLRRTDYFLTNFRLHVCRAGRWEAVPLVSMEVLPGGSYGEGCGDVLLCPESGPKPHTMVNVEHAEELCALLERLIYMENAR